MLYSDVSVAIRTDGRYVADDLLVPNAFKQPDDFIPERWTTRPELVLDSRAYAPFSIGTSCYVFFLAAVQSLFLLALVR
jgi:hypothetical protein